MKDSKIFISYAWGGESEDVVDNLYPVLKEIGLNVIRDKIDLAYKGNIKEFMQQIGEGQAIIVIISDKYLRSENCMYEMLEIYRSKEVWQRIFPVVLSDAKIYDEIERIDYLNFWDERIEKLNEAISGIKNKAGIGKTIEKINEFTDIRRIIDEIMDMLRNMNTLTTQMHIDSDFGHLTSALDKYLQEISKPKVKKKKKFIVPLATVVVLIALFFVFKDKIIPNYKVPEQDSANTAKVDSPETDTILVDKDTIPDKPDNNSQNTKNTDMVKPVEEFKVEVSTNKGKSPVFVAKEEVQIYFKSNKPAYIRVLYRMADNTIILLMDNYKIKASEINKKIPIPNTFLVSEPFGSEQLQIYAQTTKFKALNTSQYGEYTLVNDDWEQADEMSQKGLVLKKEFAKHKITVITKAE